MKKFSILLIVSLLCLTQVSNIVADEFSGQEDKYIKLCSSKTLSKPQQDTCKSFNKYLQDKNKELKQDIANTKKEISNIQKNIDNTGNSLDTLYTDIENLEGEIKDTKKSIKNLENVIKQKEEKLADQLYAMQSQYNSNAYLYFILDSQNINDVFARMKGLEEITSNDKDDIEKLSTQLDTLNLQKDKLDLKESQLIEKKKQAETLKNQLTNSYNTQNDNLKESEEELKESLKNQQKIDKNLTRLYEESLKEASKTNVSQIKKPTSSTNTNNTSQQANPELGIAIANKALSRQGCRYWWGAPGGGYGDGQGLDNPNAQYFDCSGLVAWAHRQSGVSIGRLNAAGYSRRGVAVNYNQLQIGDVITFSYDGSSVDHIAIYIGEVNGVRSMVHASGSGSNTRGQYAGQCVKVNSIEPGSYFYKYIHNCRRLY